MGLIHAIDSPAEADPYYLEGEETNNYSKLLQEGKLVIDTF